MFSSGHANKEYPPTVCHFCGEQKPPNHIWTSFSTTCICEDCLTSLYTGMRELKDAAA